MIPGAFYPPTITTAGATAGAIKRGDAVRLSEAARCRHEIPYGAGIGVLRDCWVESGRAVALVAIRLPNRTVEVEVGGDELTKEA